MTTDSLTAELMQLEEANLCLRPLAQHLFESDSPHAALDNAALLEEVMIWIEKRGSDDGPSFEEIDPKLGPMARYVWNLIGEREKIQAELCETAKANDALVKNLDKAAERMVQKQRNDMYAAGHHKPEEVGLYKVRVQHIEIWRSKKMSEGQEQENSLMELVESKKAEIEQGVNDLLQKAKTLHGETALQRPDDQCDLLMGELKMMLDSVQLGEGAEDMKELDLQVGVPPPDLQEKGVVDLKEDAEQTQPMVEENAMDAEMPNNQLGLESEASQVAAEPGASPKSVEPQQPADEKAVDTPAASQVAAEPGVSPKEVEPQQPADEKAVDTPEASQVAADLGASKAVEPQQPADEKAASQVAAEPRASPKAVEPKQPVDEKAVAAQPGEEKPVVAQPAPDPNSAVAMIGNAMRRKDTMALALQAEEEDEDALVQEDGTVLYVGPGGKLETGAQRDARLRHNLKMKFHRSFESTLSTVSTK